MPQPDPLFELRNATKKFDRETALDNLSITINRGERLAIVGESGSGKSTLLRVLLGLTKLTSGSVTYQGEPFTARRSKTLTALRRDCATIFQDPASTFNPFLTLRDSIFEPLVAHGIAPETAAIRVQQLLSQMLLPADSLQRYPHEFSGGQRQRLAAVRALALQPQVLFADEPVSALDSVARTQFLTLLQQAITAPPAAAATEGAALTESAPTAPATATATVQTAPTVASECTLLLVTHDLSIVPELATTVAVMRHGKLIETGSVAAVFADPQQQYTKELVAAANLRDARF